MEVNDVVEVLEGIYQGLRGSIYKVVITPKNNIVFYAISFSPNQSCYFHEHELQVIS